MQPITREHFQAALDIIAELEEPITYTALGKQINLDAWTTFDLVKRIRTGFPQFREQAGLIVNKENYEGLIKWARIKLKMREAAESKVKTDDGAVVNLFDRKRLGDVEKRFSKPKFEVGDEIEHKTERTKERKIVDVGRKYYIFENNKSKRFCNAYPIDETDLQYDKIR